MKNGVPYIIFMSQAVLRRVKFNSLFGEPSFFWIRSHDAVLVIIPRSTLVGSRSHMKPAISSVIPRKSLSMLVLP